MLILVLTLAIGAVLPAVPAAHAASPDFDHTHAGLDSLLANFVVDGAVDYVGLREHRSALQAYLANLGAEDEKAFHQNFTREQQLAFLINAYNAFTLDLILEHYPVASIQDIPGNWTEPRCLLFDRKMSLNDLENKIIRPRYGEARIHFALVCAAKGCPPLRSAAYVAEKLEEQLTSAASDFARDRSANRLDKGATTLYVSKLFEWYMQDFAAAWGETEAPRGGDDSATHRGVVGFFIAYLAQGDAAYLRQHPVSLQYLEYDWDLNAQAAN
jgi:AcrR family transcriptional regulator